MKWSWKWAWSWTRGPLAAALVLAMARPVWNAFATQRPLASWYFPRLAATWGFTLLFALACLAIGVRIVKALTGPVARDGFWPLSFAVGVLAFGVSMGLIGHLGLFGPLTFGLLPLVLLGVGWAPLTEAVFAARRRWRHQPPLSAIEVAIGAAGVIGLVLTFLPVLAPENVNYDARWYHLAIAERYALVGGITRSVEGNHLLAGPHLASLLYTWAFLRDGTGLFERVLLANHLEVACFLGTLALIPSLARSLLPPGANGLQRMAWVAMFLFPALYIYDTGLMGGADHIAAIWAPAALLTWFQARERKDTRSWMLFGLTLAALALAKYTSVILIAPLVVAVVIAALPRKDVRARLLAELRGPLIAGGLALAVTSLHWLRNLVFYGNPIYPLASRLFTSTTPWTRDSLAWHLRYSRELFVPGDARFLSKLDQYASALWGYHLDLYTWRDFTAGLPVFGSLYAISLVLLPFLRGARRLWLVALMVHVGVLVWFVLAHQMRYLLLLVPLMAASCAVVATEVWRWQSWPARGALIAVVGLQLVGAGDVPFAPTHRTNGRASPLGKAITFLGRGVAEENETRFQLWKEMEDIGAQLPPKAVLLVHSTHATLGINRLTLNDAPGIEYGLNYAALGSVRAIHTSLVHLGVTHVSSVDSVSQPDSVAGELLFKAFMTTATEPERKSASGWSIAELSPEPPPEPLHRVLYLGCGGSYGNGLYELEDLAQPLPPSNVDPVLPAPRKTGDPRILLAEANYVVQEDGCPAALADESLKYMGRAEANKLTRAFYVRRIPLLP